MLHSFAVMQDASNYRLDNTSAPVMDTKDPYPWLEFDDPRRFQTDREILELAVDLSQSCLTKTQQVEFMDVLEKYKDAFCLRDEIGLAPNHGSTPRFGGQNTIFHKTFYSQRRYETEN